jgi:hypothetical protein
VVPGSVSVAAKDQVQQVDRRLQMRNFERLCSSPKYSDPSKTTTTLVGVLLVSISCS